MDVSVRNDPLGTFSTTNVKEPTTVQVARDPRMITISREQEIKALRTSQQLAMNPMQRKEWENLTALAASDFRENFPRLQLPEFTPGWVIVGQKPGGIEGGCIVRRTWTDADENFEPGSGVHAAVMDLHANGQLGSFQDSTVEESLNALRSANKNNSEFQTIYKKIQNHDEFNKSFMVKVIFGEDDISGNTYYCPGARKGSHRRWTARNDWELRQGVINEYLALRVAGALAAYLVPKARLGKIDDGPLPRFFLMTEIGGSGIGEQVRVETADKITVPIDEEHFAKEAFKTAYAITVGLLNDWDANADDNVGIQISGGQRRPFMFDLGHACPDAFTMDARTLMPTCRGGGGWFLQTLRRVIAFLFGTWVFQMGRFFSDENFITVTDRAAGLRNLVDRQNDIFQALDTLIEQFAGDDDALRIVTGMRNTLETRISYLRHVLEEHDALMLEPGAAVN
ncbi:MAG: hypothetical protein LBF26_01840 [Puniceicoccales bacterium]|jgi:hypothetical protein|nr:hypothetical protein [Puniceicoccales bacterium]